MGYKSRMLQYMDKILVCVFNWTFLSEEGEEEMMNSHIFKNLQEEQGGKEYLSLLNWKKLNNEF